MNNTVHWYLDKYIYINGKVCPGGDNPGNLTSLNIIITSNEKLMPNDLLQTNESYTLDVSYDGVFTINAT
jgi:hypothetical protein